MCWVSVPVPDVMVLREKRPAGDWRRHQHYGRFWLRAGGDKMGAMRLPNEYTMSVVFQLGNEAK